MKRVITGFMIGALTLGVSFFMPTTHAQEDESGALRLTTSPLPISLSVKPGENVSTELRVRNSGNNVEVLKVDLMKFSAYGEEGKPQLEERGPDDDYFDWVTFSEKEFTAEPNTWHSITMTVAVPETAAFGYYYAATFSRANPSSVATTDEAKLEGGTATLVLLDVFSPNAKRELKLHDFRVERKTYEFLPAKFTVKLENVGNIHTAPSGTIFIKRGNKQVAAIDINASKGNILPASSRNFVTEWTDGFPVYTLKEQGGNVVLKDGKPTYSLSWDTSKFNRLRFGKYTAQLVAVYDNGREDVPLEAIVTFWVIPWRLIFIGIAVPVVPAVLVFVLMRWRFKRRLKRGKHGKV